MAGTKKAAKNYPKTVQNGPGNFWSKIPHHRDPVAENYATLKSMYVLPGDAPGWLLLSQPKKKATGKQTYIYIYGQAEGKQTKKHGQKDGARQSVRQPSPKRPKDGLRPTPVAKTQEINIRKAQKMMSATKKFPVLPTPLFQPPKNVKTARVKELKFRVPKSLGWRGFKIFFLIYS